MAESCQRAADFSVEAFVREKPRHRSGGFVPGSAGVTHDFNDQGQLIWRPTLGDRTQQGNRIKKYNRRAQPARRLKAVSRGVRSFPASSSGCHLPALGAGREAHRCLDPIALPFSAARLVAAAKPCNLRA